MKSFRLLAMLMVVSLWATAQNTLPASMLDVNLSRVDWERGEVLVRFADNQSPVLNTDKSRTKISAIDAVLADFNSVELEQLFPVQKPIPGGAKGFTTYTGKYYEYPKLTNIYKVSFKDTTWDGIFPLISALENLGSEYVVYAEPNYKFETDSYTPPSDPLYQFQYNTEAMNADSAWQIMSDSAISEEDIIIAILDTGVDTAHVDLKGKKHLNMIEVNGQPGVDDDGNGFIDDISGWDFVNLDNGPLDDNLHGTHCATIAVANHDTIGIAGVAPNAKYMSVKCLESSGWSNSATIAQAVTYAANNGADVISMSLGGYGRSLALENALGYSYAFALPVGAAGNDAICIRNDGKLCPDGTPPAPMYPGAYTFVLGVQATMENPGWNGYRVGFSNYDFDGPAYTDYTDDFNYEVYAPGTAIMGGIPNNGFTYLSGTSMATPAVAGAVAIYKAFRPLHTNDRTFVDFIKSWYDPSGLFSKGQGYPYQSMDLVKAIYPEIGPMMWMDDFTVVDSVWGDGDGVLDAGETVEIRVDMKNVGHYTDSVLVGIRMSQFEDKTIIDYVDSTTYLTGISSYATVSNNTAMFKLTVDQGVVNGRNINFNIYSIYPNGDTTSQDHWVEAQSGCEYNGIYSGTIEWGPECGIIVTGNTLIDTLIIKPGTFIQMHAQVGLAFNHLVCVGKPDSMIVFTKNINDYQPWSGIASFRDEAVFKYTIFEYGSPRGRPTMVGPADKVSFEDCIFRFNHVSMMGDDMLEFSSSTYAKRCLFEYNSAYSRWPINLQTANWSGVFENNIISGNYTEHPHEVFPILSFNRNNHLSRITKNTLLRSRYNLDGDGYTLGIGADRSQLPTFQVNYLDSNYFGHANSAMIDRNIYDFTDNSDLAAVDGSSKRMNKPSPSCHGHVWKVELDSTDINIFNNPIHKQLGLGTHMVKVYFNRAMDVEVTPFVTFGVRQPYTQNIIGDSTSWSSDSLVWTGYFTVDQTTSSDGYNKIGVRNALDNEGFPIPIEDYRFEFKLDIATSLSNGFTAYGDTAQINMFWEGPDSIVDLIGYNIYRRDTTNSNGDTVLINPLLIQDTVFADENVIGGVWYQYFYTSLRSNFSESQISKGVWATPYSSKPRVETLKATEGASGQITFNANVDANFLSTEARFKYGTNKNSLTNSTAWENVGSDYKAVSYDKFIQSALAGTIYYYRVEAQNILGTTSGGLDSLLTRSTPSVSIAGATELCEGDSLHLEATFSSLDSTVSGSWWLNGTQIATGSDLDYLFASANTYNLEFKLEGDYTNSNSTIHTVEVIDATNSPVNISYTGSTQLCQGESLTLTLPGGYSGIQWSTGDTLSSIVVTQTGNYSATLMSNTSGCSFSTNTIAVNVAALPSASITSSQDSAFCAGESTTLSAASGMASYKWYKNGTEITGATSNTLSVQAAGAYAVEVTNSAGCTALGSAYSITVNALPTGSISNSTPLEFCQGDSVVLSAPSGMATYVWSNGSASATTVVSTTQSVGLTITDVNGCSTALTPVSVVANYVPTMTVTSSSSSICVGEALNLQASGGFSTYSWSNGATTQSLNVNAAGTYTVTGTTADGCTAQASQTITVNTAPTATITNLGSSTLCSGDSTTLEAPSGMSSYAWSNGATTQSITVSSAGSYDVEVTDANGCSATSAATTIATSQITAPTVTASGATTLCSGSTVTLSAPTGYASYLWSDGSMTSSISVSVTGNYDVTVTNADGCASTSVAATVTINTLPTATVTSTGTGAICVGTSETLSGPTGMSSYQWYKDGTALSGATSASYTANATGNYTLEVVDANGCSALSSIYTITIAPAPTATITNLGSSTLCSGDSTTLEAPSGMSSYAWSNGATTQSITVSSAGSYDVEVTDANGCSATSAATTIATSQITAPTVTASGTLEFCDGGSVTLGVPMGYASYAWSNGPSSTQQVITASGDYYASVSNSDGCAASSDTVTVVVNPLPATPTIAYTMSDTIMVSSTPTGNQWFFNGITMQGETNDTLRPYNFGNYSVMTTDVNGCSSSMSAMQFYNSVGFEESLMDQISLYPNPTTGMATLNFGAIAMEEVKIVDALGRTITTIHKPEQEIRIDLSEEAAGMYFVQMTTSEGQILRVNIAKQ